MMSPKEGTKVTMRTFSQCFTLMLMTLPSVLPGDPQTTDTKRVYLDLPGWVYWQLVGTAETENEDLGYLFVTASRAIIADFDGVEALALRKIISAHAAEGYSDPAIAKMLDIPARRVRAVRIAFGIESQVRGRGRRKAPMPQIVELVA